MGDVTPEVMWYGIAFAMTAGASLVTLLGLCVYLAVLRKRWLPLPRLRPGTWTGREVIFAFCVVFGFKDFIIALLFKIGFFLPLIGPPPDPKGPDPAKAVYALRCISISSPMTLAVVLGLLFAVMFIRTGTRPRHYGLTWARWPANLGLGLAVFLLAWPVIMGIHALAGLTFSSSFDLFTALGKQDPRLWEWLLLGFQTIVAAPVVEEILFRGILQKWLRRATLAGHLTLPFVTLFLGASGFAEYDKKAETYTYHYGPLVFTVLLTAGYASWLYHLVRRFRLSEAEIQRWQPLPSEPSLLVADSLRDSDPLAERAVHNETRMQNWTDANAKLAIFGTAMLFAVVHAGNWPAPLALFPMGLALGWLSHRTQSLIGPIVFHSIFNLTSFIALYGTVTSPP